MLCMAHVRLYHWFPRVYVYHSPQWRECGTIPNGTPHAALPSWYRV